MNQASSQPEAPQQAKLAFEPAPPPKPQPDAGPVWFQRISLFIRVLFCIYLGVIVTVLPWWQALWDHNSFLLAHPQLWAILRPGPVRGIISGFGLLDIWIGISEAINYRDRRSTSTSS